jgi:hypothetical protein
MIPWYRQVLALVLSLGIMLIALWGIDKSPGRYVVLGAMAMSFVTLLLVFGVEIDRIELSVANGWLELTIPFTSTGDPKRDADTSDKNEDEGGDEYGYDAVDDDDD